MINILIALVVLLIIATLVQIVRVSELLAELKNQDVNTITDNDNCSYNEYDGQIYLTVGTGGHSHSHFKQKQPWSVIQNHNDYGFMNIKLLNDGKTLYGEFISNNGKVMDAFRINLNDNSLKNLEDEN